MSLSVLLQVQSLVLERVVFGRVDGEEKIFFDVLHCFLRAELPMFGAVGAWSLLIGQLNDSTRRTLKPCKANARLAMSCNVSQEISRVHEVNVIMAYSSSRLFSPQDGTTEVRDMGTAHAAHLQKA